MDRLMVIAVEGWGGLENLSPFFSKLKGRLVSPSEKSSSLCFQHSGAAGE